MRKIFTLALMFFIAFQAIEAQRMVTGTVTDESGGPLLGANVLAQGSISGTITDIEGIFELMVPDGINTLIISFTGFQSQEVDISATTVVTVTLAEGQIIDEIIVTGYTSAQRSKITSSISSVSGKSIENLPVTDVNQALQGRAPGVFTTANSGQPGAQQQVRIRGTGSITAGRNPLYVIDGIIIEGGDRSVNGAAANAPDILASINPNDIESINILKDAAATSLYGARGANGVVVINTKRGRDGKTELSLRTQYGITSPNFGKFQMMSPQEVWDYERLMLANSGFPQAVIESQRPRTMLDNTTDWVEEAFRNGVTSNVELQAQGGSNKTQFFLSGGYFNQEGTLMESDFDRTSLRSNITHKATDKLSINLNFNSSYSKQTNAVNGNRFSSPLLGAFVNTPLQGKINPETDELFRGDEPGWTAFLPDNFLYSTPINYVNLNTLRILSKLEMSYNILDNLRFTQNGAVDFINIDEKLWQDPTTNDGRNQNGFLNNAFTNARTLTTQSMLTYFKDIGEDHSVNLLGVYEYQRYDENAFSASGIGFASGKLQTLNSSAEPQGVAGAETLYSFQGLLGQVSYGFKNRYNLSASFRRDGSSRFGANNRWANFWSVGASWDVAQESFLSSIKQIQTMRLRASYGTTGNAAIGNFSSLELYTFGNPYLGEPGSRPQQISNPDLTWEKTTNLNVGLDFTLFRGGRVGGTVEWYRRKSTDLLLNVPVSSTSGFTTALRNVGSMQNQGVELTLNLVPVQTRSGFRWSSDFNISFNRNKILSLPDGEDILNGSQVFREGFPVRSFYMESWAGVNPANGTPLWHVADDDGNISGVTGLYRNAGRFINGNAEPDFIAGWTNTFSFKGISLSAFFYTVQGNEIYNNSRQFIESDGQRYGWSHLASALDHWKAPGDISSRPQPRVGGNNAANNRSTRFLEDASFIRLRNIQAGYVIPQGVIDKMKIGGIRVYVQGQNLWTRTNYSGFDPEADENGTEFFRYPVGKSLTFGIDVTF